MSEYVKKRKMTEQESHNIIVSFRTSRQKSWSKIYHWSDNFPTFWVLKDQGEKSYLKIG